MLCWARPGLGAGVGLGEAGAVVGVRALTADGEATGQPGPELLGREGGLRGGRAEVRAAPEKAEPRRGLPGLSSAAKAGVLKKRPGSC